MYNNVCTNNIIEAERQHKSEVLFEIIYEVSGVDKKTILSKNRHKDIAMVRNIAGYMLNKEIGMKVKDAAKTLGIDHSTIVYYGQMFESNYAYWQSFKDLYDHISKSFWDEFTKNEAQDIELEITRLEALIVELKEKHKYLTTKND